VLNQFWRLVRRKYSPQKWIGILLTGVTLIAFQNCGKVNFATVQVDANTPSGNGGSTSIYTWAFTGNYGACSTTCGTGSQSAVYICVRNDGVTVANSFCDLDALPSSNRVCSDTSGCSGPTTTTLPITPTTTTLPTSPTTTTLPPSPTTTTLPAPPPTTTTQPPALVYSYNWNGLGWTGCSTTCGSGTSSPIYNCMRSDGAIVNNGYCSGIPLPWSPQICSNTSGCAPTPPTTTQPPAPVYSYSWNGLGWTSCNNTCGSGTSSPIYNCMRNDALIVDNAYCSGLALPWAPQVCSDNSGCPPPTPTTLPPPPAINTTGPGGNCTPGFYTIYTGNVYLTNLIFPDTFADCMTMARSRGAGEWSPGAGVTCNFNLIPGTVIPMDFNGHNEGNYTYACTDNQTGIWAGVYCDGQFGNCSPTLSITGH
jgi:hypothetical protein